MSSSQPPSPTQPQPQPQPPPPPPPTAAAPRRVPPPCWSHDETLALIDAYRDKWYSLRRGNLKAPHWQEVADSVSRLSSPLSSSPKTSVQCRHKIEKLRKRYRSEKQRASASASSSSNNRRRPAGPVSSNWVFFKKMEAMERGPDAAADEDDDEDDDDEDEEYEEDDHHHHHVRSNGDRLNSRNLQHLLQLQQLQHHQRQHLQQQRVMGNGGGGGFRLRIPATGQRSAVVFSSGSSAAAANKAKSFVRVVNQNPSPNSSPNPNFNHPARVFNSGGSWPRSGGGGSGVKREAERDDSVAEMVSSIRLLGEGFVRMEQRKIEMAREMEQMRMEMELKRTQMILESQQRIVEAFAKGLSSSSPSPAKKKLNRVPSSPPES